jgi:hypothetical protein
MGAKPKVETQIGQLEREFHQFIKLWQKKRPLAVLLIVVGLLACGLWYIGASTPTARIEVTVPQSPSASNQTAAPDGPTISGPLSLGNAQSISVNGENSSQATSGACSPNLNNVAVGEGILVNC